MSPRRRKEKKVSLPETSFVMFLLHFVLDKFPGDTDVSGTITSNLDPWLDGALSGMNSGIRRRDHEQLVIYVNMQVAGVVSSSKSLFIVQEVTRLLHQFPRTAVAVIVLPNRAGDLRVGATKSLGSTIDTNITCDVLRT